MNKIGVITVSAIVLSLGISASISANGLEDFNDYVSDPAVKAEYDSLWNTSDDVIGSIQILSAEESDTGGSIADIPECVSCEEIEIKPSFCSFEKREQMQSVIYRFETELTNHSEQEIMEIRYQFRFLDETGAEVFSGRGVYNGQDTPVKPGETVISEQSGRIKLEKEPASWEFQVLEAYPSEEIPPIHLPQEGELLTEALSDVHFENITEAYPVKIEVWIDHMGDLSEATITDEETIRKVTDTFSKIRIGKQTFEVVTDNYNGIRFCFADGTESVISLNLKNLEYSVYHGYQYHELENFEAFWQLMNELTR
ncbi:MAG: hypothetical protein MRZ74_04670 [Blautia sp.]|nr:hypothetical protein [Blautia sp.]MDY5030540.1 hypothetical protein [Blautia sp.]